MPAHNLHNKCALMGIGRRDNSINSLDDSVKSRVGSDSHVCPTKVVIDRSDHSSDMEMFVLFPLFRTDLFWEHKQVYRFILHKCLRSRQLKKRSKFFGAINCKRYLKTRWISALDKVSFVCGYKHSFSLLKLTPSMNRRPLSDRQLSTTVTWVTVLVNRTRLKLLLKCSRHQEVFNIWRESITTFNENIV